MPSVTINFSAAHATRIQAALEDSLLVDEDGQPRAATLADLKDHIISDVFRLVRGSERRAARKLADESITGVDLT